MRSAYAHAGFFFFVCGAVGVCCCLSPVFLSIWTWEVGGGGWDGAVAIVSENSRSSLKTKAKINCETCTHKMK